MFYSLDGTHFQPYTGGLSLNPTQTPVIYAFAEDKAANRSGLVTYYPSTTGNQIDNAQFFVQQHYLDFLNREPDISGIIFWTNNLNELIQRCTDPEEDARARCVLAQRAQVSTAFFLSIEFQQTGYYVIRFYVESFGRLPTYREFIRGSQAVGLGVVVGAPGFREKLEDNQRRFSEEWAARQDFKDAYDARTNAEYVNLLFANAGAQPGDETELRAALVNGLNAGSETRATVLRKVADSKTIYNKQYNPAFVLMQYFGYLRRNPSDPPDSDMAGFNFWLAKLNSFSQQGEDVRDADAALARVKRAEMVEAFIDSDEYRKRFAP